MKHTNQNRFTQDEFNTGNDNRVPQTRMTLSPSEESLDRRYAPGSLANYLHRGSPLFPESRMNRDTTGIHSGKGPKSYRRSDERIQDEICQRLTDDPYIDASEIEVDVKDAEVILRGTVDSKGAKRRTEDVVDSIRGISHVENRLRVQAGNHSNDVRSQQRETFQ